MELTRLVKRSVRKIFGSTPKASPKPEWRDVPNDLPWFDQPNALADIERRKVAEGLSEEECATLRKWVDDGYVILDNLVVESDIDEMVRSLDSLWKAGQAIPGLTLLDVLPDPGKAPVNLSHEEILKLDDSTRKAMQTASNWRIHGYCLINEAAGKIYRSPKLERTASLIFGRKAIPSASINFMYGSKQAIHQDMGVFHIHPQNYLIGAWIACEDISPDSGPMFYHPKSHKVPFFSGFYDYPQTNLRTIPRTEGEKYHQYLNGLAKDFELHLFTPKKGQVLLWHGMLLHGGSEIKTPGLSRKSYVIHYFAEGVDREQQVTGPFNW